MTTSSRPAFSRGDVVYVPATFTNLRGWKYRPAVVVSSDAYNRQARDIMIATVTSQLSTPPRPGDHLIQDWQGAGLQKPSLAQAKIATVAQVLVRRRIGRLAPGDLTALEAGLRQALDL